MKKNQGETMHLFELIKETKRSFTDSAMQEKQMSKEAVLSAGESEFADSSSVSFDEVPYYRPDNYYTTAVFAGTQWERKVITLNERKRISYPSERGLYVAEILLLEYCSYGNYPKPRSGYPGFWWFEYGIRDVGHVLAQLQKRGFIEWSPLQDSLTTLKVDEIKQILNSAGLDATGKKSELIKYILSADGIVIPEKAFKYRLTDLGLKELAENAYVPYMHKHPCKTTESERFGKMFNVWSINRQLAGEDVTDWMKIVGQIETERFGKDMVSEMLHP